MRAKEGKPERKGERGSVLAVATLGMLALLLAVGLGVDISRLYLTKTELQNAADAASLAGVSALNSSSAGITKATDRAVQTMNSYAFNKTGVVIPRSNVLFAVNLEGPYMSESAAAASPKNIRFVQVTTPALPSNFMFASVVAGDKRDLSAASTAGMSVPPNIFVGWIPLSVIDYDIPMTPGNVYTIRAAPQNEVSEGNYQVLAAAGSGASDVRGGIASGVNIPAGPGGVFEIDTKPGVNSGPVRQGIETRFDDYASGMDPAQFPPDTNIKEGITYQQYRDGSATQSPSHPGVEGRRVVLIPIVKKAEYDQGRNTVKFDRFGAFFLRTKPDNGNGGDIEAEYIGDRIVIGGAGFDPAGGAGNPLLAVPVLYK
ncbi:MAG TPA: Tad domain-containing protein [Pyrinomonadaceae bacterium]|nr:Tad domain-containing protein [Pyrinomonadaceae bacterium]